MRKIFLAIVLALATLFVVAGTASAATSPVFRGKTSVSGATTSLAVPAPTGTVSGDVQIVEVQVGTNSTTLGAAPTGWARIQFAANTSGDSAQTAIYTSTTATGSATFTKTGTRGWQITRIAYSNALGVGPSAISGNQASSTSHATPSVTTVGANDLVVGLVGSDRGTAGTTQSWTPPSGWTERHDTENNIAGNPDLESETIAEKAVVTQGTATTGTFVAGVADDAIAGAVVVKAVQGGDITPPDTTITASPPSSTTSTSADFSFTATETGSTFQCQLDGGIYAACTSPKSYTGLAVGSHTFNVKATDPAGNVDPTPATYTWTVTAPSGWTTVLDDEFNVGASDLTPWSLYDSPYGSSPGNCARPSQVSVSGGVMHMLMSYRSDLALCGGTHWTTAGMQLASSYASVNQRITVRYKVVNTDPTNVRSHRNMPMHWGDDSVLSWPANGEIDYCEGSSLTDCSAFIHYYSGGAQQVASPDFFTDFTQFVTLRAERLNHTVKIYINDLVNPVYTYTGNSTTLPDTLQRVVLQQECRSSCPATSFAGQTEDIQVDWITVENAP